MASPLTLRERTCTKQMEKERWSLAETPLDPIEPYSVSEPSCRLGASGRSTWHQEPVGSSLVGLSIDHELIAVDDAVEVSL